MLHGHAELHRCFYKSYLYCCYVWFCRLLINTQIVDGLCKDWSVVIDILNCNVKPQPCLLYIIEI